MEKFKVYFTKDYAKFKFSYEKGDNRDPNEHRKHINSMKKILATRGFNPGFPITVSEDFEIYDGQHRFMAATELGITIPFMIIDKMDREQIKQLNTTQRPWDINDHVSTEARKGNKNYQALKEFSEAYKLSISTSLHIINNISDGGTRFDEVKAGRLVISETKLKEAKARAINILDAVEAMQLKPADRLIRAFIKIARNPQFSFTEFKSKLKYQLNKTHVCSDGLGYELMIEDIYNYRRTNKVKLIGGK